MAEAPQETLKAAFVKYSTNHQGIYIKFPTKHPVTYQGRIYPIETTKISLQTARELCPELVSYDGNIPVGQTFNFAKGTLEKIIQGQVEEYVFEKKRKERMAKNEKKFSEKENAGLYWLKEAEKSVSKKVIDEEELP